MFENIKNSPNYRWYVLATVAIGTFMATLDGSIVNVALPTLSGPTPLKSFYLTMGGDGLSFNNYQFIAGLWSSVGLSWA